MNTSTVTIVATVTTDIVAPTEQDVRAALATVRAPYGAFTVDSVTVTPAERSIAVNVPESQYDAFVAWRDAQSNAGQ